MKPPTLAQLRAARAVMEPYPDGGPGEAVPVDEVVAALMWLSGPVPELPMRRTPMLLDAVIASYDAALRKEEE